MNLKNTCNRVYIDKGYLPNLYMWSPRCPNFTKKRLEGENFTIDNGGNQIIFCTATAGSQGQDWITTYVYNLTLINNQEARLAYVECDYVE